MAITIAILRQAGLSAETIAHVCELEEQERVAHRRTQVREAVARHRARKRGNQSNIGNDYTDYQNGICIEEVSKKESKTQTPRKARKTALPPDFLPDLLWAKAERKWTYEQATVEAQRFKDHAVANGRLQADWNAAWRNWVRSPYQNPLKGNGNGHGQEPRPYSREWRRERDAAILDRLHAVTRGSDPPDGLPLERLSDPGSS